MKMFHSSGTASGNIEVMLRWKRTMPTIAIVAYDVVVHGDQQQRPAELLHGAEVGAARADSREGRMSSG